MDGLGEGRGRHGTGSALVLHPTQNNTGQYETKEGKKRDTLKREKAKKRPKKAREDKRRQREEKTS
jgi:hypothetical protein